MFGHRFQSPPSQPEPLANDIAGELVRLEARGAARCWIGLPSSTTLRMLSKLTGAGLVETLGGVQIKVRFTADGTRLARECVERRAVAAR